MQHNIHSIKCASQHRSLLKRSPSYEIQSSKKHVILHPSEFDDSSPLSSNTDSLDPPYVPSSIGEPGALIDHEILTSSSNYRVDQKFDKSKISLNPGPYSNSNSNSMESLLMESKRDSICSDGGGSEDALEELLRNCSSEDGGDELLCGAEIPDSEEEVEFGDCEVHCPLCGSDISNLGFDLREEHSNRCLDREHSQKDVSITDLTMKDKDDLNEFKNENFSNYKDETAIISSKKLITDYFVGSLTYRAKFQVCSNNSNQKAAQKLSRPKSENNNMRKGCPKSENNGIPNIRNKAVPPWCCIPDTPFRVDAFRYLKRGCCHWFLTHFHTDHYQGLTKSFSHGMIYCSLITAKLVHLKIGVSWDKLQVLPINEKITIAGIDVFCLDANHCPGSIIILFEPPNGKSVLHTGDFRFDEEMEGISHLQNMQIHTLILDTTYCNPQYDFPKQEDVIQFVIESIQAENFNKHTLFLIGSYTIGKERLFLEVARVLQKKVHVTSAKMRLLECFGLPEEDMKWLTVDEKESHIHVVPMWILSSFKRLNQFSHQYMGRFNLIVSFSPTGWSYGKGKKSPSRRWKQGTIIRYEVPYSEHCSFSEMKDFVKLISPLHIIPSVNNHGPESRDSMIALLS